MDDIKRLSFQYFDDHANEYTEDYYLSQQTHPKWVRQKSIKKLILKHINPSSGSILNLGCGPGLLEEELADSAYQGIGLDSSPEMIRLSNERASFKKYKDKWKFIVGDCERTGLQSSSFDCLVASGLIEYMPEDRTLLDEAYRLLKKDGILIINVTNILGWSTCLNRLTYHLKRIGVIISIANFIKLNIFKEKVRAKDLKFIPRKHRVKKFLKDSKKHGFSHIYSEYQGFTILPAPFDIIFNLLPGNLNSRLEFLKDTPLRYFGASYLVALRKRTD